MIQQIIICDECRETLTVDPCDTVETTIKFEGWHDDGFEHYCPTCIRELSEKKKAADGEGSP
jgi:uncharacterized Zn ribbon protein